LPARPLEAFILKTLQRLADQENAEWSTLSPLLLRIDARAASTEVLLDGGRLCGRRHPELVMSALRRRLTQGEEVVREGGDCDSLRVRLPVRLQFRGGRGGVVEGSPLSRVNLVLVGALRSAHLELNKLHASPFASLATLAAASSPQTAYFRRLTQLAFLAPDLQQAILDGREPGRLTLQTILETDIPLAWSEQRGWWRGLT
jgi:site-specific DNA recombinase